MRCEVYKTIGDVQLSITLHEPAGRNAPTPAIVFFFGGGWTSGNVEQFEQHCIHFASRGMLATRADYRVKSRHGVSPFECVADARSAVRWLRARAGELNIDTGRVAAAGGSAGGHLAANTAIDSHCDHPDDDLSIAATPQALVLFNPVLDTVPASWGDKAHNDNVARLLEKFGTRGQTVSPMHNVHAGWPPTIIFHGQEDQTVPFTQPQRFADLMRDAGNTCHLVGYRGKGHGFFNHHRDRACYHDTLRRADAFLTSLGWLDPQSTNESSSHASVHADLS